MAKGYYDGKDFVRYKKGNLSNINSKSSNLTYNCLETIICPNCKHETTIRDKCLFCNYDLRRVLNR